LGLKSDAGGSQKPDIVVMLPEQRTMIIDSKVPLTGYERLIAAEEEPEQSATANQFLRDVKVHIDGLAGKRYQDNEKLVAHDCVLMFVPIEGALAAALTRYQLQGENAQEIARLAGDLCDKVSMSLCDLNVVTEKIKGAATAHDEAVRRLSTGKGNALSIGERIRNLGVRTRRTVPTMVVDGMAITAQDEEAA
jgi:DNA recombination protein RmuC